LSVNVASAVETRYNRMRAFTGKVLWGMGVGRHLIYIIHG
jgi:hypothetical protein